MFHVEHLKCGVQVDMTLTPAPLPWREREKGRGGFFNAECGMRQECSGLTLPSPLREAVCTQY